MAHVPLNRVSIHCAYPPMGVKERTRRNRIQCVQPHVSTFQSQYMSLYFSYYTVQIFEEEVICTLAMALLGQRLSPDRHHELRSYLEHGRWCPFLCDVAGG
jgi:hypothetical protein